LYFSSANLMPVIIFTNKNNTLISLSIIFELFQ